MACSFVQQKFPKQYQSTHLSLEAKIINPVPALPVVCIQTVVAQFKVSVISLGGSELIPFYTCSLTRVHGEVREALNQELVSAKINAKRLMCLLQTVLTPEELVQKQSWDLTKVLNKYMGQEELYLLRRQAPVDTPHHHIATALCGLRELINDIEELSLTQEQTAIMNNTELMRQNLLSVICNVRNFLVCKCKS
jgi:hypothetical protein